MCSDFERETLQWLGDVYRFAYSLTRDPADADDLVQETYLRAYRSWHTYLPGSNARSWLLTICRHCHLREAQQAKRYEEFRDDDVASTLNLHEQAAERDQVAMVYEAIDCLPEPYRSTIVLIDVEDQTYASAAAICGAPIGTIRSRLFRARRLIRGMISARIRRESSWRSARGFPGGAPRSPDSAS